MNFLVSRASRFLAGLKVDGARHRSHIGGNVCPLGARFLATFTLAVSTLVIGDPRGAPLGGLSCYDTSAAAASLNGQIASRVRAKHL